MLRSRARRAVWVAVLGAVVAASVALDGVARTSLSLAPVGGRPPQPRHAEDEFLAQGPYHRALIPGDSSAMATLAAAGAVVQTEDYGSFALAVVDERPAGGLAALRAMGAEIVDDMTLVHFNGYRLDGADPLATATRLAEIPEMLRAPIGPGSDESRLRVIQFIGPLKDAWLDALRATGAFVVTYAATNAYVVKVNASASAAVDLFVQAPYVLSIWAYEPAFKLRPELRPPALVETDVYDVILQVIADDEGIALAESLRTRAIAVLSEPNQVLTYINIGLRIDGANVIDLAGDPRVFAIEPKLEARLCDERQGQIVVGNLDAGDSQPSGPQYLDWLASRGFPGTNPFDFVVDVVDTGIDRGGRSTERVSVATGGAQGNNHSGEILAPSNAPTSADGRFVAFQSLATNLVPGDTNGSMDIFVRDRFSGTTERVSLTVSGTQANSDSESPAISTDGRWVAFNSYATNLVGGDTNDRLDVFLRDRIAGSTERISVASNGAQGNDHSLYASITADGGYVAFGSNASNLVPADTNGSHDIFVRNRQSGTTVLASVSSRGAHGNAASTHPSISADGRYLAFASQATNLVAGDTNARTDVFVRDAVAGTTERVSIATGGAEANDGASFPTISADGRFVVFLSSSTNLVTGDANGVVDVFVRDRQSGTTDRMSVATGGTQANLASYTAAISGDGRYVVFDSVATNLVPQDSNGAVDVFLRDRETDTTERVSVATASTQAGGHSGAPAISADGRYMTYWSDATNLIAGDTNSARDVFLHAPPDAPDEFRVDGLGNGASRVAYVYNYTSDPLADDQRGHGTIDASIVCGYNDSTGVAFEDPLGYQYGLGIAPWVKVGNSKVFDNAGTAGFNQPTSTRMANAYNGGAKISTNSWGAATANYTSDSQEHDAAVRDAVAGAAGTQEMIVVLAAGNGGPGTSTVNSPGTAKNVITVGASENWRMDGTDGCSPPTTNADADDARDLASFSSRGPTADSRRKPEILTPGTHIQGAASRAAGYTGSGVCDPYWPASQTLYTWSSGTSQATPAIAGVCALLRQHFINQGLTPPSPALTKALIVAGATYMTGAGANDTLWSNSQGMGRVNLGTALDASAGTLVDQTHVFGASGETYKLAGSLSPSTRPFRVVLAWTDEPGPTSGDAFVNNLDLSVTVNGASYRGNVFAGATSTTGGAADTRNNLESVFLPSGTTGAFTITVRATSIAGNGVPGNADATDQDFALVVHGATLASRTK